MALAGYDPREAVQVWERMRALNRGRAHTEWLSTIPADDTRYRRHQGAGCPRP
jgi:hypothetical protein